MPECSVSCALTENQRERLISRLRGGGLILMYSFPAMKYWCNPRWRMLKWLRCRFNGCCNWWSKLLPEEPRSVFVCQPDIRIALRLWICVCSGSISGRVAFSREIWRAIYSPLPEHQAWCCCCCCCCSYLSPLLTTPASVSPSLFFPLLFPP